MDEDVRRAITALDEDPDELHQDQTPAVRALAGMGLRAVEPLTAPLLAGVEETRLHAQRAWEGIVYARHGFVGGRGFPSAADERAAVDDVRDVDYSFEAQPAEREAAVQRLRAWLARARR